MRENEVIFIALIIVFIEIIQLACFGLLAAPIPLVIYLTTKKRRLAVLAFCLILVLMFAGVFKIYRAPVFVCPPEYEELISPEFRDHIVDWNRGFYSAPIPVLAWKIEVLNADQNNVHLKTKYLFFGWREDTIRYDAFDDGMPPHETKIFGRR
jgi:hypothetical protein